MQSKSKGTLYLIPLPLGDSPIKNILPDYTIQVTHQLKYFIAENAKTARQFLKQIEMPVTLQEIQVLEIDKHNESVDFDYFFESLRNGSDTGLVSEAGMPAVADPGSKFVLQAHKEGIRVTPLTGPSSILLSLAASGLNGQSFIFHGYLPKDKSARGEKLKVLENNARKLKQTQIFIETPYRNDVLLDDIMQFCSPSTLLCIASEISLPTEFIQTKSIADWKKSKVSFNKRPVVFLML